MKVAILNDTHFGVRNDQNVFLEVQRDFFENQFFPYLKENDIKHVLHLGDLYDRRKYINFKTQEAAEQMFFKPMEEAGITLDIIPGNHDVYYKDTNRVNSINILARKFSNVNVFDEAPVVVDYDGVKVGLMPWICRENYQQSLDFINNTQADILAGHFEIIGFEFMPGIKNHEGMKSDMFERFDQVWSGHFHHKSTRGNIQYFGAQYEMSWSDSDHDKGFHVFDSETQEVTFVKNTNSIYTKIYYNDKTHNYYEFDCSDLTNKFVKVIVVEKNDFIMFDRFIDSIHTYNPVDLSIIEDHQLVEDEEYDINQTQDTITILESFIDQMEVTVDKDKIKGIVRELHSEAISMD
jgi:DNA repair exonuclease SbcCD nuclease subunit